MQSAGPEREKYNFRKFPLLVVTLTKQGVLVSNSKAWSTLYNQCIRQSVNRYGKKKNLFLQFFWPHQSCIKSVKFHTAFSYRSWDLRQLSTLFSFFICFLFVCLFVCFVLFALLPFVQRLIQELRLPFLSLKK